MVDRLLGRGRPSAETQTDPVAEVWARVQQARNLRRPHTLELVKAMALHYEEERICRQLGYLVCLQ